MNIILAVAAGITILGLLAVIIVKSTGIKASPFLVFAIVDIVIGLIILGFAIYDYKTAVGEFAGIFGELALVFGEPVVAIILIIDIVVWRVDKKKRQG